MRKARVTNLCKVVKREGFGKVDWEKDECFHAALGNMEMEKNGGVVWYDML